MASSRGRHAIKNIFRVYCQSDTKHTYTQFYLKRLNLPKTKGACPKVGRKIPQNDSKQMVS